MMFETSAFHDDCHAMRQVHRAGGFGKLIYNEGAYCDTPTAKARGLLVIRPELQASCLANVVASTHNPLARDTILEQQPHRIA